jgi:hypothetical protein
VLVRWHVTASRITFDVDVGLGDHAGFCPEDNVWDQYASLAAHYYVSGRFAAQAGFVPLCGNLMHHAIELQLKCGLIKAGVVPSVAPRVRLSSCLQRLLSRVGFTIAPPQDADRYLQRRYDHSLRKAWRDFKRCHAAQDLSAFDQIIRSARMVQGGYNVALAPEVQSSATSWTRSRAAG